MPKPTAPAVATTVKQTKTFTTNVQGQRVTTKQTVTTKTVTPVASAPKALPKPPSAPKSRAPAVIKHYNVYF